MSEGNESSGVRRFGRKDRKRSLERRAPLFPADDERELEPSAVPEAPTTSELNNAAITAAETDDFDEPPLADDGPLSAPKPKAVGTTPAPQSGRRGGCMPNLLALLFLLATVGAVGVFAAITVNPYSSLNPFPPFTPIPILITATFLPPTSTAAPTAAPTATFTPLPLDAVNSDASTFAFRLANDGAIYAPNANDQDCNWSSIAGTVTDANGTPVNGYRIHIFGDGVNETVFSGVALTFGQGGFELFLNGTPQEKTYSVQLENAQGIAASPVYTITTRSGCDQNVAVLNFVSQ